VLVGFAPGGTTDVSARMVSDIAVHPAPGWKSISDVLKAAKARLGEVAYALSSATGTQAVAAGIFFRMAGVNMLGVPYKGGGQAVVDLVSGQVPVAVSGAAPLTPQAKAGGVRLIAVTSSRHRARGAGGRFERVEPRAAARRRIGGVF